MFPAKQILMDASNKNPIIFSRPKIVGLYSAMTSWEKGGEFFRTHHSLNCILNLLQEMKKKNPSFFQLFSFGGQYYGPFIHRTPISKGSIYNSVIKVRVCSYKCMFTEINQQGCLMQCFSTARTSPGTGTWKPF
jgi:hypothetical protein